MGPSPHHALCLHLLLKINSFSLFGSQLKCHLLWWFPKLSGGRLEYMSQFLFPDKGSIPLLWVFVVLLTVGRASSLYQPGSYDLLWSETCGWQCQETRSKLKSQELYLSALNCLLCWDPPWEIHAQIIILCRSSKANDKPTNKWGTPK